MTYNKLGRFGMEFKIIDRLKIFFFYESGVHLCVSMCMGMWVFKGSKDNGFSLNLELQSALSCPPKNANVK